MKGHFGHLGRPRGLVIRERFLIASGMLFLATIGIGLLLIVYSKTTEARQEPTRAEAPIDDSFALGQVKLYAPTEMVSQNTPIRRVALRELYWPRDKVPEGAIRDSDEIQDLFAKVSLPPGQPLVRSNLTTTPMATGIAPVLPPGHRAVTIEVDATAGLEGWATPGTHVDLFVTYKEPETGIDTTRVAVFDAVVVSYNGKMEQVPNGEGGPRLARASSLATVTLAVPFADSLKIQTARSMGRLNLALRNADDQKAQASEEFSSDVWTKNKTEPKKVADSGMPKGFAEFTGPDGRKHGLTLGHDETWRWNEGNDNE